MTTAGGLGHTLPYLIPDFFVATIVSVCVVAAELAIISSAIDSWIRHSSQRRFKSWSGAFWCSLRALRLVAHNKGLPGFVVMNDKGAPRDLCSTLPGQRRPAGIAQEVISSCRRRL
jgi:hypothetical protein